MNRQDVFNKVCKHLMTQMRRSSNMPDTILNSSCLYKAPNGDKCAIGIFVPDGNVGAESYIGNVWGLCRAYPEIAATIGCDVNSYEDMEWLSTLQNIHDHYLPGEWSRKLSAFGTKHSLSIPLEVG